ncbi:MAG: glycosyltransferase family 1 protein [Bryobacteraceae bacterium]|jgi:glycosyltransferase involved in cell wall biosynthesis
MIPYQRLLHDEPPRTDSRGITASASTDDHSHGPRLRIVVDATACLSGGRLYVNELLPILIEGFADTEWIIYGEVTPELRAVAAHDGVQFRTIRFPQPTTSLLLSGMSKLLWREAVLPFELAALRPCLFLTTANFASPLLSRLKIPVVLAIHNLLPFHEPQWYQESNPIRRWRSRWLRPLTVHSAKRATRTIAFSGYARDLLCKQGVDAARVSIIHHGIRPAPQQWSGAESDTVLLVSHYFAYKNIHVAIRALPQVQAATGRPIKLLVQGVPYDGQYYARLAELVRSHGLEESVTLGRGVAPSELTALYASARCLLFPAVGENCPITLLEAMSVGTPIVAAKAAPLPEICGPAAVYYDTFDDRSCARAITQLLNDRSAANELSAAGRQRSGADFTWEGCARKTADVLLLAWGQ